MNIFEKRTAFKPFEYPEITKFKDAINHSYWLVSEWNFTSDIQDFKVKLNDSERNAIKNAMLAISQIEVSVKRFWAKIGERFPKAEIEQVGITFGESECFDEKTEILTNSGWKFFGDLAEHDLVAQYENGSGLIQFVRPSHYISRKYIGQMHHYYGAGTDLMVTPNHEILVSHPQKDIFEKKMSQQGAWGRNYRYPCAGILSCKTPRQFTELDRLLIAIQSDGCLYGNCPSGQGRRHFYFGLTKQRKVDRLLDICKKLNIPLTIRIEDGEHKINGKLPEEAPSVELIKGFEYINLIDLNAEFAHQFLEELKYWDSSVKDDSFTYYNSNEKAIDLVQIMALSCGRSSNKGINRTAEQMADLPLPDGSERIGVNTVYALNIVKTDKKIYPYRQEIEYDGMVYCVTVPSGCIVTRRGKRVVVSGNCRHADAYSHLLEILGLNQDFELLLQNPVIQGRVDYLTKYLRGAADNSQETYTLTLALFSIFIENVSLFSQFLVIKSFNKYKNVFKDIDNVVQATQQEEAIHAKFGMWLINKIKEEFPRWFNEEFYEKLYRACNKAYTAEAAIIDWIFEQGDLSFLSKEAVKEFIKHRFNESLESVGGKKVFEPNQEILSSLQWFEEELIGQTNTDFFHKKPTTYSKNLQPYTSEDLF